MTFNLRSNNYYLYNNLQVELLNIGFKDVFCRFTSSDNNSYFIKVNIFDFIRHAKYISKSEEKYY